MGEWVSGWVGGWVGEWEKLTLATDRCHEET